MYLNRKSKRVLFILVAVLFWSAVIWGIVSCVSKNKNESEIKGLIDNVNKYASMETTGTSGLDQLKSPLKIFIISNTVDYHAVLKDMTYSELNFQIDKELRAKTPEDLNTLIRLEYSYKPAGSYTSGDKAIGANIHMTIVDIESGLILEERDFYTSPTNVKVKDGDEYASFPDYWVVDYINSLGKSQ